LKENVVKLTREKYAVVSNKSSLPKFSVDIYADEEGSTYSNEWCNNNITNWCSGMIKLR